MYVSPGREAYDVDPAIRDAILYQIIVLGEAVKAALAPDPSLASDLPEVEWSPIARMRDRVTHQSWRTDREIVRATATIAVLERWQALASALQRLEQ